MLKRTSPFGGSAATLALGLLTASLWTGCGPTISDDDTNGTPSPTESQPQVTVTPTETEVQGTPGPSPTAQPTDLPCRPVTDLQDISAAGHPNLGDRVKVCDVIVTAIRFDGTIYVGDAAGGVYSGIYVFQPDGAEFIPDSIALGDSVTIVGEYALNFGVGQIALFSDEVPESSVTVNSSDNALPPAVAISDASTLATTGCDSPVSSPDAAKYEGVRVSLSDVDITDLDPCGQGSFGVFEVADSLWIDDDLGNDFVPVGLGETLSSVTGVLHFTFDYFRLFPGPGDIESAGNVTPPPCSGVEITSLQDDTAGDQPALNTEVSVCEVVVTAVEEDEGFVVQEPDGTAYSGIFVFEGSYNGPTVAVGDVVNVSGTFEEFFGSYQLSLNQNALGRVSVVSNGADLPAPVAISDISTIATPCAEGEDDPVSGPDARKYEGVRLSMGPVTITDVNPCVPTGGEPADGQGRFGVFEVDSLLFIDDDFGSDYGSEEDNIGTSLPVDTVLSSVTGVLHLSFNHYRLFPNAGDIVVQDSKAKVEAEAKALKELTAPAVEPLPAPGQ